MDSVANAAPHLRVLDVSPQTAQTLRIDVLTLFPEVFEAVLESSILGIAKRKNLVSYHLHNIRDYTLDKHGKVDDRPYGGGPGMIIQCEPVFRAYEAVRAMDAREGRSILLTPQGKRLDQQMCRQFSRAGRLILLCGHYEGFDERIRIGLPLEEVSVGDYVLSGGEIAAMVLIDATVRLLPGVVGHSDATAQDSFSDGLLEYPQYTRPAEYRGMRVPEVLLSGNHEEIKRWRYEQALLRTRKRRADLLRNTSEHRENNDG